jgi:hypothetical protein
MSKYTMDQAGYKQSLKDMGWSHQKVTATMKQLDNKKPECVEDFECFLAQMLEEDEPKVPPAGASVSDEEYSELLEIRLAAKHGFDEGTVTLEEYNMARTAVRRARKVRRSEGAVVENYRQQSAPQHRAMTRKAVAEAA